MITKDRLEELIKQKATIYFCTFSNIKEINYNAIPTFWKTHWEDYEVWMYETKEEAEEYLEFGNIQRTQKLKLPLWNEMQNKHYIRVEFRVLDRFGKYNEICIFSYNRDHEKYNNLEITICNEDENQETIFDKPLTKENYDEARRICKKLFLGGI